MKLYRTCWTTSAALLAAISAAEDADDEPEIATTDYAALDGRLASLLERDERTTPAGTDAGDLFAALAKRDHVDEEDEEENLIRPLVRRRAQPRASLAARRRRGMVRL